MQLPIPIIDVFAGPGGLCEGFSSYRPNSKPAIKTALSIEMDTHAHQTLTLRAFFRQFYKSEIKAQAQFSQRWTQTQGPNLESQGIKYNAL